VTWDEHSLFVRGERIFLYSGEFHPWRLPSVDLWTDVLQKIKAIGYNGVSFYVDWAPLEGRPGHFSAEGVFAYEPFFAAAEEVGLYLIARPGPYSKHALVRAPSYQSMPRFLVEGSPGGFRVLRTSCEPTRAAILRLHRTTLPTLEGLFHLR
jgi:beta-galactosidase GanA